MSPPLTDEPNYLTFRQILRICAIGFCISYGLSLLNGGAYWDDWWMDGWGADRIVNEFKRSGFFWTGYYHKALLSLPLEVRSYLYRIIVFLSYGVSAFLGIRIFARFRLTNIIGVAFFSLTLAIYPLNFARYAAINSKAAICNMLFFVGWTLAVRAKESSARNYLFRTFALLAFYASFETNSLLVFYLLPFLHLLHQGLISNRKPFFVTVLRNSDFLLLPILYWLVKGAFLPNGEGYATYNEIHISTDFFDLFSTSLSSVARVPIGMLKGKNVGAALGVVAVVTAFVWPYLRTFNISNFETRKPSSTAALLGLIVLSAVLATFPYIAVGKPANVFDWTQRNGLLYSIPVALVAASLGNLITLKKKSFRFYKLALGFIFVFFSTINFMVAVDFQRDWQIQEAIVQYLKKKDDLRESSAILFNYESIRHQFALRREIRMYECTGWVERAYGPSPRFAYTTLEISNLVSLEKYLNRTDLNLRDPGYHMERYLGISPGSPVCTVTLKNGEDLSLRRLLPILNGAWLRLFDFDHYQNYLESLVQINHHCELMPGRSRNGLHQT